MDVGTGSIANQRWRSRHRHGHNFTKEEVDKAANKRVCNKCGPPLPPLPCRVQDLSSLTVAALKVELQRRRYNLALPH
jgi:hypothetical protein